MSASLPDIEPILKNELKRDEEVLWADRPVNAIRKDVYISSISMLIIIFVIPYAVDLIVFGHIRPEHPIVIGLCLFLLIAVTRRIFKEWRASRHLFYVLTNQRAMIITTYKKIRVDSYAREELGHYGKIYQPDGSGSIVFQNFDARPGKKVAFAGIRNVKHVADMIDTLTTKPQTELASSTT